MKNSTRLEQFADVTSIHGIHTLVFGESKRLKAIWGLLLLCCVAVLGFQIVQVVSEFSKKPTTIRVRKTRLEKFPILNFCSFSWMHREKWENFSPTANLFISQNFLQETDNITVNDARAAIRELESSGFNTTGAILYQLVFSVDEVFDEIEDPEVYDLYFDSYNRVCIEEGSTDFSTGVGINGRRGVKTTEFVPVEDGLMELFIGTGSGSYGPLEVSLKQGLICDVQISARKIAMLNSADYNCKNMETSVYACDLNCDNSWVKCTRNCSTWGYSNDMLLRDLCLWGETESTLKNEEECERMYDDCAKQCLPPCEYIKYGALVSSKHSNYQGVLLEARLENPSRYIEYHQEHYIYTNASFISNLGGILSLFTGASCLSLFHAVYFWFVQARMSKNNDGQVDAEKARKELSDEALN